jgi:hypothetical protein
MKFAVFRFRSGVLIFILFGLVFSYVGLSSAYEVTLILIYAYHIYNVSLALHIFVNLLFFIVGKGGTKRLDAAFRFFPSHWTRLVSFSLSSNDGQI